jgi:E3 ubiquitin-protein ligase HECTD1
MLDWIAVCHWPSRYVQRCNVCVLPLWRLPWCFGTWQEEEGYEVRNGKRRSWDDEYVLKRQFSALIPAFDPRPGRTNVNQTTDLEVPPPGADDGSNSQEVDLMPQPKLQLVLRGPNLPGVSYSVLRSWLSRLWCHAVLCRLTGTSILKKLHISIFVTFEPR